jgi:hypothetical protein
LKTSSVKGESSSFGIKTSAYYGVEEPVLL